MFFFVPSQFLWEHRKFMELCIITWSGDDFQVVSIQSMNIEHLYHILMKSLSLLQLTNIVTIQGTLWWKFWKKYQKVEETLSPQVVTCQCVVVKPALFWGSKLLFVASWIVSCCKCRCFVRRLLRTREDIWYVMNLGSTLLTLITVQVKEYFFGNGDCDCISC